LVLEEHETKTNKIHAMPARLINNLRPFSIFFGIFERVKFFFINLSFTIK
jgi:hypothetical protein